MRVPSASYGETSRTLDEWQSSIARSFVPMEVAATDNTPEVFLARLSRQQLGSVGLSVIHSDSHRASRTQRNVFLQPADYYKISYQTSGRGWIKQDGRSSALEPGDLVIYDTTRPYEIGFIEKNASIVAQVPRSEIDVSPDSIAAFTARNDADFGGLRDTIAALMTSLSNREMPASTQVRHHLARSFIELLRAAALSDNPTFPASSFVDDDLWASMRRYALAQLSDSSLSIDSLAASHFVSVRTAQRLFKANGTTFAEWIRRARMENAERRVKETSDPITLIALESGFSSSSHFSKAFKAHFGHSAREVRQLELAKKTPR